MEDDKTFGIHDKVLAGRIKFWSCVCLLMPGLAWAASWVMAYYWPDMPAYAHWSVAVSVGIYAGRKVLPI